MSLNRQVTVPLGGSGSCAIPVDPASVAMGFGQVTQAGRQAAQDR
jgi:hypothetical protein